MKVGKAVHNLDRIKPGDKIHATYTLETEFVISSPNTPLPADTQTMVVRAPAKGELPAAVVANHLVVTGAVLGIDKTKHTLKLVDPKGGQVHTIVVSNKDRQQAMSQIKVGDTITAYVTESLLVAAVRKSLTWDWIAWLVRRSGLPEIRNRRLLRVCRGRRAFGDRRSP